MGLIQHSLPKSGENDTNMILYNNVTNSMITKYYRFKVMAEQFKNHGIKVDQNLLKLNSHGVNDVNVTKTFQEHACIMTLRKGLRFHCKIHLPIK